MIALDESQPSPNPCKWRWDTYRESRDYAVAVFGFERDGIKEERQRIVRLMLGEGRVN